MSHLLARSPGHVLFVFNLELDTHVMVNWHLSNKGLRWPVSYKCIGSGIQLTEVTIICWPIVSFQLISGLGPFLGGI